MLTHRLPEGLIGADISAPVRPPVLKDLFRHSPENTTLARTQKGKLVIRGISNAGLSDVLLL